jgi:hypothetical protein
MTYFTGPLEVGTAAGSEVTTGKGYAILSSVEQPIQQGSQVLSQTTTVSTVSGSHAAVSATITLPANSQIIAYYVDTIVAATGTIASLAVTVGTAAGGEQYMTSTDMITATRGSTALTVAQLAAMDDIGANTSVVITIDANAAATTTQGTLRLTVVYSMK